MVSSSGQRVFTGIYNVDLRAGDLIEAPPIGQGTRVPDLGGDLRDGGFSRRKRWTVGPGVPGAASYHTLTVAPLHSPFRGRDGLPVDTSRAILTAVGWDAVSDPHPATEIYRYPRW